ncbi:N-acetyltransferase [Rhodococcoides trifolii]|uniref:N-acetyltransferase n=1 Tax=Rhodococcoides trifolii TaxID=908250 RepID=A0A917CR81_9NOCA|nr:GNAT family N-acetyltransferase [Rhodococcus trifolii]GGF96203.1 N-acetyltransferase [Rhodococcus trifolii]
MADVVDVPERNRYEIREDGTTLGYAEYKREGSGISFLHTIVEPEYGGRGLAGQLIRFALDDARSREETVLPYCPFVKAFIKKHPDYVDLVPERQRGRFDL